ncbi:hypothetical protein CTI12_AA622990 [Artemisia annua]|uniref:Uncharacterized protein n=1 Tax=Artemisia annua TaxID=35608 RepID=A0A2U1KBA5_ARTAN|nr:hypothetical protein CTI12_AA622990 [Artemisia annua]
MKMVNEIKSDAKMMSCSSIAMLQERFRQLEKMKEMREERELLKLIPVSSNNHQHCLVTSKNLYEPSHMFFHSEIIFPTRLPSFDSQLLSLSLWPKKKHDYGYWDIDIQNITNTHDHNVATKPSWLSDVPMAPPSVTKNALDETSHLTSEVDTTLHL